MPKLLRFAALLAFLAVLPAARAADVSGTWKGAFEFEGTAVPLALHLSEAGATVTGTIEGLPATPAAIHDGKIDGDTVSFWVNTDYQGTTYKLIYKGKIVAGQIEFSFGTEDGSWGTTMIAKNDAQPAAPAIAGTWKGSFEFEGSMVPVTFHLASSAGAVTGTIDGIAATPTEIHDGKVDGDTVTFWLNADYQGSTYKLICKGKVSAAGIQFSFGTEDGSWGTEMTATRA